MPSAHPRPPKPLLRTAALLTAALLAPSSHAQDAWAGRNLAATCAPCHGTHGIPQGDLPVLAGMPADKIIAVLAGYKNGMLSGTIMPQIARGFSDEQIALVAAWLAALPPKPAPKPASDPNPQPATQP